MTDFGQLADARPGAAGDSYHIWGEDVPPTELTTIRDTLCEGRAVNPVTVREFLSWFDAKRRGISIVARIREELESLQLSTVPDLEEPWIDGLIAFHLIGATEAEGHAAGNSTAVAKGVGAPRARRSAS